jgi:hypothetical protein
VARPCVDRQREQQGRHQQRLHQQDGPQPERHRLQRESDGRDKAAQPPLPVAQEPLEQLEMAHRLIGDLVRGSLVDDVADRDEERGAEGEQGGDVRLGHR